MPAAIFVTLSQESLIDAQLLLGLAIAALVCVALYSTWPEWRK